MSKQEMIQMELISDDMSTQVRVNTDEDAITHYSELVGRGVKLPPADLFYDKAVGEYFIGDGWHRYLAYEKWGAEEMPATVYPGTQRDALFHALGANHEHGVHRTNADKRNAVTTALDDDEWSKWTNRRIASHCGVHHSTVDKIRDELTPDHALAETASAPPETRESSDGRQMPAKRNGPSKSKKKGKSDDPDTEFDPKNLPAKETSGKEKVSPEKRKKAKKLFGEFSRLIDDIGENGRIGKELDAIATKMAEVWGKGTR